MIRHTFIHLPSIGIATEQRLWQAGVLDWEHACGDSGCFPAGRRDLLLREMDNSREALARLNGKYFAQRLQAKHLWRLYPDFRGSVAFFDIETTGLDFRHDAITTIALYDGHQVRTYVNGQNLGDFPHDIARYKVLVTYNGKCFDVPFIEAKFPGLRLDQAHIDLRYLLAGLGCRGGLKGCEVQMGLARPAELRDVDGFLAVRLWRAHLRGDDRALPALLRYNVEDVVNLRWLMETAYNLQAQRLPIFVNPLAVVTPEKVEMPLNEASWRSWSGSGRM